MTEEAYCEKETATLLKEKGFDGVCQRAYTGTNWTYKGPFRNSDFTEPYEKDYCALPTQQMAMRWLREKYNIFIRPIQSRISDCTFHIYYDWGCCYQSCNYYNSYEEAIEEAIKYAVKNLI